MQLGYVIGVIVRIILLDDLLDEEEVKDKQGLSQMVMIGPKRPLK